MMFSHFQWWRRLRGGRWAKVTGWLWGFRWIRVGPECVERVDESYDLAEWRRLRLESGETIIEIDEQGKVHPPEARDFLRAVREIR